MPSRRSLWIVCLVAALHGVFFTWYQSPDWTKAWSDQGGYRRLGQVLATTGRFTRFPDSPAFVPEVIRTPGYPLFVAAIYRVFGAGQVPVALAQTALFAGICLLVYAIGRRVASERTAWIAAMVTALFPPIPYFAALVMTEVWTTLLLTLSMWIAVRAMVDEPPHGSMPRPLTPGSSRGAISANAVVAFAALGIVLALTALSRPAFVLFPIALAGVGLIMFPLAGVGPRRRALNWAAMLASFAVTMLPWFTYNYATLGALTLSPAGGVGRGLWEGSWQATWSGRLQSELTRLADDIDDRGELDRRIRGIAARERLLAEPMLEYVHQWEDIRRIWTEPVDSAQRARARARADREYLRVGLENIRRDSAAHLVKRIARGMFVLWAGEIPFRYSDINDLPPALIYFCWAIQAALACAAAGGLVVLARRGRAAAAWILATPLLYITAVHVPLLTEARQSLPAQPIVLLLATIAVASARTQSRSFDPRSLPGEPQVHERQHL